MTGGSTTGSANAGNFTFSPGALPAGGATQFDQAFANFLLGVPATFTQANIDAVAAYRTNIYEGYVQNDFHASRRVTLTAGIRYTYFASGTSASLGDGYSKLPVQNFDPDMYVSAHAPTLNNQGVICTVAPCAGGKTPNPAYDPQNGIIIGGKNSPYGDTIQETPNKTFAPRVGFTYDVFGNGKTALRGGFGLYYLSVTGNQIKFAQAQNYPNIVNATISNPSFANPGNGVPQFSASPSVLQALQVHASPSYSEQYSFDLQQQLKWGTVLDIGYYGNHGVHLFANIDNNQAPAGLYVQKGLISGNVVTGGNTAYLNQIRPYIGYSAITTQSSIFGSNYNSLQTTLRKQVHGGGIITASYTYSKALTNARTPQNSANLAAEYSHTDNDRVHIFNTSFVYPLPFFKDQQGVVGHIAGGVEFSGIISFGSGQYLTPTTSAVDPGGVGLLVGPATGRPDYIRDPNTGAPHTLKQWFNASAFSQVPSGQYRPGNSTPDSILGPGYQNWDLSVFKNIRLQEQVNFQLRAEAYNAFNHTNFSGVQTTLGSSNYGQITSTGSPRILQMGAKVQF